MTTSELVVLTVIVDGEEKKMLDEVAKVEGTTAEFALRKLLRDACTKVVNHQKAGD